MKNCKGIIFIVVFVSVCALYLITQTTNLNKRISIKDSSEVLKLEVVLKNPNRTPVREISDSESIIEIMDILNDMKFIPSYSKSRSFEYKQFQSYEIKIFTSSDFYYLIIIYSNQYIGIDGDVFRIIHKSEVSKIYDIMNSNVK